MGFARAVASDTGDQGEEEFKQLAADMLASFARMRRDGQFTPVLARADLITDDRSEMSAGTRVQQLEIIAQDYLDGRIALSQAKANFEKTMPLMLRFLIREVCYGDDGKLRALPYPVQAALEHYQMKPTAEHASDLVNACIAMPVDSHWLFDNVARAFVFCDHAAHHGQGLQ